VGPDPARVRNGNRKGDTYRRDRTLLVRQGCGCPGSDGRARAISASQARRGEHAGYRRCGGSGWSRRVVFGRGLGGPGAADPCDERYRVPARIGVEDPHVRRDHGARGGRGDRSGHGYQHVPAVRGPHPSRPRRPDHDAESPDAHVGDPRSLAGMGTPWSEPTLYFHGDSPILLGDFCRSYFVHGGTRYRRRENFYERAPGSDTRTRTWRSRWQGSWQRRPAAPISTSCAGNGSSHRWG
jgi:hypothetical protein